MIKTMCLSARRELLRSVGEKYQRASSKEKRKILDGFIAATEYDRKYVIRLLRNGFSEPQLPVKRMATQKYDGQVLRAMLFVWHTANQICSKRLVPFLPSLVESMERHGHLRLPADVRKRLLSISAATIDRLLKPEREKVNLSVATT
jgi:hypothetical protein